MAAVSAAAVAWVIPDASVVVPEGHENAIGRGAYGFVRRAMFSGASVAAKGHHFLFGELPALLAPAEIAQVRADFSRELDMLARVRHPNVLTFYGATVGPQGLPRYILTELMAMSLHDLLHTHAVEPSLREVVHIALSIACGLAYLHSALPPLCAPRPRREVFRVCVLVLLVCAVRRRSQHHSPRSLEQERASVRRQGRHFGPRAVQGASERRVAFALRGGVATRASRVRGVPPRTCDPRV